MKYPLYPDEKMSRVELCLWIYYNDYLAYRDYVLDGWDVQNTYEERYSIDISIREAISDEVYCTDTYANYILGGDDESN